MKPDEFLRTYLPLAQQNENDTGVPHMVTLAQAALESGWGAHAPGNNFFGIKAGSHWLGETQTLKTWEVIKGKKETVFAKFRKYPTALECFRDHAAFLKKRFPKAFAYKDAIMFINAVQNDHEYKYATDPDYLRKMTILIYSLDDKKKSLNLC